MVGCGRGGPRTTRARFVGDAPGGAEHGPEARTQCGTAGRCWRGDDGRGAGAAARRSTANPVTREQRRSRRKRAIRAKTISVKRMTKRELELGRMLYPEMDDVERPRSRAECSDAPRPCPFVSCKHHLYLDVSARTGAIKLNFPDLEVWEMTETCALDVADRGGTTLEEVGAIMNLTRERIRQVEVKGLAKLAALRDMTALRDYVDEGPIGKRRLPVLASDDGVGGRAKSDSEADAEADRRSRRRRDGVRRRGLRLDRSRTDRPERPSRLRALTASGGHVTPRACPSARRSSPSPTSPAWSPSRARCTSAAYASCRAAGRPRRWRPRALPSRRSRATPARPR